MKDTQLYSQILGIEKPWKVTNVQVSLVDDEVEVTVEHGGRYDGVVALDALLPGIAAEAGVEFVEMWDVLVNSGLSVNQLMKDPIHPSAMAHTIIAETVFPVVASINSLCGDETCDPGENSCTCDTDCGTAPGLEQSCSNLVDDDCDGHP